MSFCTLTFWAIVKSSMLPWASDWGQSWISLQKTWATDIWSEFSLWQHEALNCRCHNWWKWVGHHLNNLNLLSGNFHIVGLVKEALGGQQFNNMMEWGNASSTGFWQPLIFKMTRWKSYQSSKAADYVINYVYLFFYYCKQKIIK